MPARPTYDALIEVLHERVGDRPMAVANDLEAYATAEPPADYSLDHRIAGAPREALTRAGWPTFHLVGYSEGGVSASAFAAKHPDHPRSLALLEPACVRNPPAPQRPTLRDSPAAHRHRPADRE
jgi:pimeloyl-ACP methyl ester carboxylesterase